MTIALITGVPRSGTSLVCACLNTAPDCVALVEPMDVPVHGDAPRAVAEIVRFAQDMRTSILARGVARSVTRDGAIPDNTFEEIKTDGGLRHAPARVTSVRIDKPLTERFRLFIKHPAVFTALARPLAAAMPLYAVIRHPLASLASWQTVDTSLRDGRWPVAEAFSPELQAKLDRAATPLLRQVALLQWMLQVYRDLPPRNIVRYEAVVEDPGQALAPMSGSHASLTHPIRAANPRSRYPHVDLAALAEALLDVATDIEAFYPDFRASLRKYL